MTIHTEHPFLPDPHHRDRARQLRGRLTSPVTIVTSGAGDRTVGLTISSLLIIEGESPMIQLVVGPTSDLWDVMAETGVFVVHVCDATHTRLSDVFAGLRPSPGGMFASLEVVETKWGPTLSEIPDRAYCRLVERAETGYSGLVTGAIDQIELTELSDPLVYYRGRYRGLA